MQIGRDRPKGRLVVSSYEKNKEEEIIYLPPISSLLTDNLLEKSRQNILHSDGNQLKAELAKAVFLFYPSAITPVPDESFLNLILQISNSSSASIASSATSLLLLIIIVFPRVSEYLFENSFHQSVLTNLNDDDVLEKVPKVMKIAPVLHEALFGSEMYSSVTRLSLVADSNPQYIKILTIMMRQGNENVHLFVKEHIMEFINMVYMELHHKPIIIKFLTEAILTSGYTFVSTGLLSHLIETSKDTYLTILKATMRFLSAMAHDFGNILVSSGVCDMISHVFSFTDEPGTTGRLLELCSSLINYGENETRSLFEIGLGKSFSTLLSGGSYSEKFYIFELLRAIICRHNMPEVVEFLLNGPVFDFLSDNIWMHVAETMEDSVRMLAYLVEIAEKNLLDESLRVFLFDKILSAKELREGLDCICNEVEDPELSSLALKVFEASNSNC